MDKRNTALQQARVNKNDEFYTTYESVEEEISHYKEHFLGKTVYCNADNPRTSEFSRYFQDNFRQLGLKRLIVTSYNRDNTSNNGKGLVLDITDEKEKQVRNLEGDGDFRSEECIRLLDESDIVVTNPPFSLMREMISLLESHKKNYLLVATENVLTYKEVFPLVQQGKLWTGYNSGNMNFRVPDDSEAKTNRYWQDEDGQKWRSLGNVVWLTNLETDKHRKRLELTKTYSPEQYPKYDNYDAINVDRVENIPVDYPGVMGVPVTILKKINTEQFEIVGEANHGTDSKFDLFEPKLDGKALFKKILIKNKSLMENEKIDNKDMSSPERVSFDNKEDLQAYIMDYCSKHGWDSDLNHIDVSEIKDMSGLFAGTKFTGDISKWDVSNVTDMRAMFKDSYFNGDLSGWNMGNVENMSRMFDNSRFNGDITNWNIENVKYMNSMFLDSYFTGDISKLDIPKFADTEDMFADSEYELQHPGWKDEIELQKSRKSIQEETIKQDTTMEAKEEKMERQSIVLSPEQLLDRALDTAAVGNGKWLNHKSIHSPQLYGYTNRRPENTLSGFQQVLLSLNSHENQYHTNIYVTRKGINDNNLALDGDQKGILLPCPDGSSKQFFNLEQLDQSTVKDGYANSLLAKSKNFKTLNMAETDDVTRNRELLEKDPTSIVMFRKGERFFLYEESAMKLRDLTRIDIRTTPETGVKYTSFKNEDIERFIKSISDSGHRVVIANSAYSFKGANIRKHENMAVRNIQSIAANEGFSIGRVTCMPSNYMPKSDTVSLNVTGKERSTLATLREIGEIYHAGLEALYSDSRLAGFQKLPMGQREGRKFSQLVLEVATGVQMIRQGLPAIISEENMPLIPFWQQELRENPKAIELLTTHVDALTEAMDRSIRGHKVDYDLLLPTNKDIQREDSSQRPEQGTISRTLGDYTDLEEKKFVVVRDPKESAAIVIFPTGASTLFDKETKGFNKDDIDKELRKENFNQVYFFTPDAFESMNKNNGYFKDTQITVEKIHYGKLEKIGKIDVGQEIKRTLTPEFAAVVPFINAQEKRRELYIRTTSGEEITVPLSQKDVKRLAYTIDNPDRAAANQTRLEVAQKYYLKAKSNPEIVSDYLHPNIPQEKYDLIERSWVTRDENRDYFIGAQIDGNKYPLRQMSFADKSLFIFSDDKSSFKQAIVTRAFAEELGLGVKTDVRNDLSGNETPKEAEQSNNEEEQPRRGFRR